MCLLNSLREIASHYQTGVQLVLLGQEDLWSVGHDMDVGLIVFPGGNVGFL